LSLERIRFVFVHEAKRPPKRRAVTAKSAALESVQAVIARLEGKIEKSMETRSEDSFHARDVAPAVVQQL
jgi:hypothetical protein